MSDELFNSFKSKWLQTIVVRQAVVEPDMSSVPKSAADGSIVPSNANSRRSQKQSVSMSTKKVKCDDEFTFQRICVNKSRFEDLEDFMKEEFYQSTINIYTLHLNLIEKCFEHNETLWHRRESAQFINQTFAGWHSQMKNRFIKHQQQQPQQLLNQSSDFHLVANCKLDTSSQQPDGVQTTCLCLMTNEHVMRACSIAIDKHTSLLSQLNKVYNFKNNYTLLKTKIHESLKSLSFVDQADLIGLMEIQDKFNMENLVVPLMLQNKYGAIDSFINKSEPFTLEVVKLCDYLCNSSEISLKDIEKNYPYVRNKRIDQFKTKNIAKYAANLLKRIKKLYLVNSQFRNIDLQLKLTQMRFLINLMYNKSSYKEKDPISEDAWVELLVDLIGDSNMLKLKLISDLTQFHKDYDQANKFISLFGYDLYDRMSPYMRDELIQNLKSKNDSARLTSTSASSSGQINNSDKFYYPNDELNETNIKFVGTENEFREMLDYFEQKRPTLAGMDCEWKPYSYDIGDEPPASTSVLDTATADSALLTVPKQPVATFQLATRDFAFIIDTKYLIDQLSDELVEKFGELVLFSDDLVKLGYSFQQDANKLYNAFPKLKHKFSQFSDEIINIDEIVTIFQQKWVLFPPSETETVKTTPANSVSPSAASESSLDNRSETEMTSLFGASATTTKPSASIDTASTTTVEVLSKPPKRMSKGLSELTRRCFGKPLDKSECLSNWERRPLRKAQLRYAALDAYVLIQVHDFINKRARELGVQFDYTSKKQQAFLGDMNDDDDDQDANVNNDSGKKFSKTTN